MNTWKERKMTSFCSMWCILACILFATNYSARVNAINATMMSFSYKYGFISRGFIGTIYQFIANVVPYDMFNYNGVVSFTYVVTMLYIILLFSFIFYALSKCELGMIKETKYIISLFTVWAIPMFVSEFNFGRLDVYCVMLSLLSAILIISNKCEWLVVLFSAIGVMVHQGNVFMYLNIILAMLIYKAMSEQGVKKKKYYILFFLSFSVASVLFLYFEFFSHGYNDGVYQEIVDIATSLCYGGQYHKDVVDHEILGINVGDREYTYRLINLVQFPIFIVLMIPYISFIIKLFKRIIKDAETKKDKWKYFFLSIGAGTILPNLILKCDYGRWMFAIICYYFVIIITLLAMRDKYVTNAVKDSIGTNGTKILLFGYTLLLQPLSDVEINYITSMCAEILNTTVLHLW